MQEHEKPWAPLSVAEVSALFALAEFPWWIAGGIALELEIGKPTRPHADIDVLVLRRNQIDLRNLLRDWDCWAADPPGTLRFWPVGEALAIDVHDVWCRRTPADDWQLQLMLDGSDGEQWVSRRDDAIRLPLDELGRVAGTGVSYVAPHVQLYYKAKNPRAKDEQDLAAVLASGVAMERDWLVRSIVRSYGPQHPWIELLNQQT